MKTSRAADMEYLIRTINRILIHGTIMDLILICMRTTIKTGIIPQLLLEVVKMIPKYSEIKNQIKIDIPTGRAIIPDLEFKDHNNIRTPDMADFNDNMAVKNLYRRLLVVDAMNTIIRNANNENISLGDWLYFVDEGSKG